MRSIIVYVLSLLISKTAFTQPCINTQVINPAVAKATAGVTVSASCSTMVVKWTGTAGQSYIVTATRYNPTTNIKDTVTGSAPVLVSGLDYTSTIPVVPGTQVTWSVQASSVINGTTYYSYPLEGTPTNYPILACGVAANTVRVSGKIYLQGCYNSAINKMDNTLNSLGILQSNATTQPFNIAPFNYTGTESVGAGFFAAHPTIVDWVLIELRDSVISPSVLAIRAAFVTQDGSLLDTAGVSTSIVFTNMPASKYFVAIYHRNHLGVRSAAPVNLNTGLATYDFTNALSKAYNGGGSAPNNPMTTVTTNIFGMYGGNANADLFTRKTGSASVNDYSLLYNAVSTAAAPGPANVYSMEDFNMDGNVRKTGSATTNDYSKLLSILGNANVITRPVF